MVTSIRVFQLRLLEKRDKSTLHQFLIQSYNGTRKLVKCSCLFYVELSIPGQWIYGFDTCGNTDLLVIRPGTRHWSHGNTSIYAGCFSKKVFIIYGLRGKVMWIIPLQINHTFWVLSPPWFSRRQESWGSGKKCSWQGLEINQTNSAFNCGSAERASNQPDPLNSETAPQQCMSPHNYQVGLK